VERLPKRPPQDPAGLERNGLDVVELDAPPAGHRATLLALHVVGATVEEDLRDVVRPSLEAATDRFQHAVDDAIGLRPVEGELPLDSVGLEVDVAERRQLAPERDRVLAAVDSDAQRLR